jgi:HK97 family phage portal protein
MTKLTLRERLFGVAEERSLPAPENQLPLLAAYTGSPVNTSNALAIADVWSCVRLLSATASSLPIHVFRKTERGRERVDSGFLVDLLDRPGPGTTQADLVSTLMSHVLIWGAAYLAKYRTGGTVTQIGLLEPDRIRPEVIGGQLRFRYSPGTGPQQLLTERDVTYVKGLSTDGLTGLSAVTQAARVLGLSDELVRHAVAYFEQDKVRPAGVLKMAPDASSGARSRMVEALRADAVASSPGQSTLVIEGEGEYEPVEGKLDDQQFAEQRRLATQEVARVFGVPSHLLNAGSGGDSLTYSTSESMSADFLKYSLGPWLRRVELAISNDRDLTFERTYVRFNADALLRPDAKTRAEVYTRALDPVTGWLSREEVRELEDRPPEPDRPDIQPVQQMVARPPAEAIPTNGGNENE